MIIFIDFILCFERLNNNQTRMDKFKYYADFKAAQVNSNKSNEYQSMKDNCSNSIDGYPQSATKRNQHQKHMRINNDYILNGLGEPTKNLWNYSEFRGFSSNRSRNSSFHRFLLFTLFALIVVLLLQINSSSLFDDFWSQGKILSQNVENQVI